jgi:hypothetical protein
MRPVAILAHLALRAVITRNPHATGDAIVWVGRAVWPFIPTLCQGDFAAHQIIRHSLFVDPANITEAIWAAETALRNRAVAAVVADVNGIDRVASRRLQLAAESSGGVAFLTRSPRERRSFSSAVTRWQVQPQPRLAQQTIAPHAAPSPVLSPRPPGPSGAPAPPASQHTGHAREAPPHDRPQPTGPRWTLELLRCKGVQPDLWADHLWTVELCDASGHVVAFPQLGDRTGRPQARQAS